MSETTPMYIYRDPSKPATVPGVTDWGDKLFGNELSLDNLVKGTNVIADGGKPATSSFTPFLSQENKDLYNSGLAAGVAQAGGETPWYQDSGMLGSIAGLGSAFAQLAALPSQIDYAKTQSKALKQNMATAKEEQARRNKNISAFNSFKG